LDDGLQHTHRLSIIILYYAKQAAQKVKKKYKIQVHNKNIQETENYNIDSGENYSNIYRKTEISELSLDFK